MCLFRLRLVYVVSQQINSCFDTSKKNGRIQGLTNSNRYLNSMIISDNIIFTPKSIRSSNYNNSFSLVISQICFNWLWMGTISCLHSIFINSFFFLVITKQKLLADNSSMARSFCAFTGCNTTGGICKAHIGIHSELNKWKPFLAEWK